MTLPLSSEQIEQLIAGYVLGDLDADEAAEFEQLLAQNPVIVAEIDRVQKALELSHGALPETPPPPSLRAKILEDYSQPLPTVRGNDVPLHPTPRRRAVPWGKVAGVAAAALIVALGVNNYRLWQALQTTQAQLQQTNPLIYSLQGTKEATQALGTVVVNPNKLEGVLKVENLPALPPDKVYVMWTVVGKNTPYQTDAKGAILTQVFKVGSEGSAFEKITVPEVYRSSRNLISKVAVTMENAASPEKHVGPIVMVTNL
ncbi:anti-sigma factor [Kovacikia minuta CCNUW1]|uniref:anti-sigma factor n=1 Tax=Kovacikia minuta TaxID=2931930 RepID=UPI001CCBA266|nr:anti-sigma factor [Kovacikia minuta]UBF27862.1 anti-sigma factor [Kovacikia minuta CCNUW1]